MPNKKAEEFYRSRQIAVLGMSRKKQNFGWHIHKGLTDGGVEVFAVHPGGGKTRDVEFYESCSSLPESVDAAVVCFDIEKSDELFDDLKKSNLKKIWFQQGSFDKAALDKARQLGFDTYTGCALMYAPDTPFFHRIHRFFHELFAKDKD